VPTGELDDQVSTTTVYVGTRVCLTCAEALTPLEVDYNGEYCTVHKRAAQARLLKNKRVGAL
jgi:hypothetical protein